MNFRNLFRLAIIAAYLAGVSQAGEDGGPSVRVFVGKVEYPAVDGRVRVPMNTSVVRFELESESLRIRYKMDGLDDDWQEKTDDMNFIVRFIDGKGNHIRQVAFPAVGTSPGWRGEIGASGFVSRRETVPVPPTAMYLSIAVSSSGPAKAVGVISVRNISVVSNSPDGDSGTQFLDGSLAFGPKPWPWIKAGSHPTMAGFLHREDGASEPPALYIVDDDIGAHADIASIPFQLTEVTPGVLLDVRWEEMYSIGIGGMVDVGYDRLPAGTYKLLVEEMSVMGVPSGKVSSLNLYVPGPYWRKWWFWLGCVSFVALLAGLWGRAVIRRRVNRHLRHSQLISDERLRIARDLHDDLGTRLSHISLIGSRAEGNVADEEARSSFRQITELTGELVGALSETVWMLNPKNNDLESLVDFLCRLVSELCRLANIRCRIDAMQVTEDRMVSHEFRHNVTLSVKESVNNALRHSKGTEIQLKIWVEHGVLKISVADNGTGIQDGGRNRGNGLKNIAQRMKSVNGTFDLKSSETGGVRVTLTAPLK